MDTILDMPSENWYNLSWSSVVLNFHQDCILHTDLQLYIYTNDPITEDVDCILHSPLLFIQSNTQLYVTVYVISSKISCFPWFLSSLFSIFSHQTCSTCNVLKHSQDQKDLSKCFKSRRCLRIITSLIKSYMHLKYPAT